MTGNLYMIRLAPHMSRVAAWAHERGLVKRGGDMGYTLHVLLKAAFGDHGPKPFFLQQRRGRNPALFGYCDADEAELRGHAKAFAEPDIWDVLSLRGLGVKPMPSNWEIGRKLGFDVRTRPVVRQDAGGDRSAVRERDAFLAACDAAGPDAPVHRTDVYRAWFAGELSRHGGARLAVRRGRGNKPQDWIDLAAFQRHRAARRAKDRKLQEIEGPDALLSGVLEVTDGQAFSRLLARGIGRHRAFGFGMLLLRPPPMEGA